MYDMQRNHRHTIRLKGYDYSKRGMYFITICTQNRAKIFGEIKNNEMFFSDYGKIAEIILMKVKNDLDKKIALISYVIMQSYSFYYRN